jgi:hypothetical protein
MERLGTTSFEELVGQLVASSEARDDSTAAAAEGLHVCCRCGSRLVHPTWWAESDHDSWEVALRCPSCEWFGAGRFDQSLMDEFERELDRGDAELAAGLARFAHANMADAADRFIRALAADAIQPIDF